MENKLPYIQLDRELHYNIGVFLIILENLAQTKTGKDILTIDKLQTFYFLVTRPVFLNRVLSLAGKNRIDVEESDYYNVNTLAVNVDELFDKERILIMIRALSSLNYLSVKYSPKEGFLFRLNQTGELKANQMQEGYFLKIRRFVNRLVTLQSQSPSKLNGYINIVLKQGI